MKPPCRNQKQNFYRSIQEKSRATSQIVQQRRECFNSNAAKPVSFRLEELRQLKPIRSAERAAALLLVTRKSLDRSNELDN